MPSYGATQIVAFDGASSFLDSSGRARVSQITTLFDGKIVGGTDSYLWDTAGTGVMSYENNKMNMAVGTNQYAVYQTRRYFPYFSGKPQLIEMTLDRFDSQPQIVKRMGYFSSSEVAPYTADFDGFWLEDDGVTKRFVMYRKGVQVFNVPLEEWMGRDKFSSYNWANFTVVAFDFLWLGGAVIRMYIKHPYGGFELAHAVHYAGTSEDVFMLNPAQPIRYEIRSSGGVGDMRAICSLVGSEGSLNRVGKSEAIYTSLLTTNTVGTTYALAGVRGLWNRRHNPSDVSTFGGAITTADSGVLMLLLNPTLSAPLTWTNKSVYSVGTVTTQTVVSVNRVLDAIPITGSGVNRGVEESVLPWLAFDIDGTPDTIILAYTPVTTNQALVGTLNLLEY